MRRPDDWLEQAQRDLDHARVAREAGHFEWAVFAAQQAAEEAAKSMLQRRGLAAMGHSVEELLGMAGTPEHLADDAIRRAELILDHGAESR